MVKLGEAYYNLRDFTGATSIFKKLAFRDPKNEEIKFWLEQSVNGNRSWIAYAAWFLCGIALLLEIFFSGLLPILLHKFMLAVGLVALVFNVTTDIYLRRNIRSEN